MAVTSMAGSATTGAWWMRRWTKFMQQVGVASDANELRGLRVKRLEVQPGLIQAQVVARRHERIANRRKGTLHKLARGYVNGFDVITVEELNVSGMVQNHHLARSISDAAWSAFRQIRTNKAASAGRRVIAVAPHFTSQKCSGCGEYVPKSLSVRTHVCPYCGLVDDRDVNAAKNILRKGLDEAIADCPTGTG